MAIVPNRRRVRLQKDAILRQASLAQTCIKLLKSVAALSVTFERAAYPKGYNDKGFAAHQRLRAARIDTFFADPPIARFNAQEMKIRMD